MFKHNYNDKIVYTRNKLSNGNKIGINYSTVITWNILKNSKNIKTIYKLYIVIYDLFSIFYK